MDNGKPLPTWGPAKSRDRKGTKYEKPAAKPDPIEVAVTGISGEPNGKVPPDVTWGWSSAEDGKKAMTVNDAYASIEDTQMILSSHL